MVASTRLDAQPVTKGVVLNAAKDYARIFNRPTVMSLNNPAKAIDGRLWVMQSMQAATFGDEFDLLHAAIENHMGQDEWTAFQALAADHFTPRDQATFEQLLADKLAINPDGSRIPDKIGTTVVGEYEVWSDERQKMVKVPIYAGSPLQESMGAASMTLAASLAIAALDAVVDSVDEGTGTGFIRIVSGTRPADPDAALTGTILSLNTFAATAFAAAVDDTDGTVSATAAAIADDTSADATNTATHFRVSSSNDGAAELDAKWDGNVGTSGEDLNLNTVSIVAGATVSITSFVVGMSQGSGAT